MSAITVGGELVHYEVLGRGKPVILLHGWIGSWRYWIPIMRHLQLRYRVYGVDLFGFGDSGKNPAKYPVDQQVILLQEFMKQLGIPKAAIIAHGLGAQVLTEFARHQSERVARMLLASAPLFDPGDLDSRVAAGRPELRAPDPEPEPAEVPPPPESKPEQSSSDRPRPLASKSTRHQGESSSDHKDETVPSRPEELDAEAESLHSDATISSASNQTVSNAGAIDRDELREAALARSRRDDERLELESRSSAASHSNGGNPLRAALSGGMEELLARCFRRSEPEFEKFQHDLTKSDDAVVEHVTRSFDPGLVLDTLRLLDVPTVVVHGEADPLIPAPSETIWHYLIDDNEDKLLAVPLPGVRHFPMLEYDPFQRLVSDFLEIPDISKIELKERWRRRSR